MRWDAMRCAEQAEAQFASVPLERSTTAGGRREGGQSNAVELGEAGNSGACG